MDQRSHLAGSIHCWMEEMQTKFSRLLHKHHLRRHHAQIRSIYLFDKQNPTRNYFQLLAGDWRNASPATTYFSKISILLLMWFRWGCVVSPGTRVLFPGSIQSIETVNRISPKSHFYTQIQTQTGLNLQLPLPTASHLHFSLRSS